MRSHFTQRPFLSITMGCLTAVGLATAGCSTLASNTSSPPAYEQQLAEHLANEGAKMYGAYWCPHCAEQKELFGDAEDAIPYVECAADGENAQPQLCEEKGIQGYPTWEIGGEFYMGARSLNNLAELSNFQEQQ